MRSMGRKKLQLREPLQALEAQRLMLQHQVPKPQDQAAQVVALGLVAVAQREALTLVVA